ncbi:MAG: magnesium transporter [Candidatus Diapherotrites archaeon]
MPIPKKEVDFELLPLQEQAFALLHMSRRKQGILLRKMSISDIVHLFHFLDTDTIAKLLLFLPETQRRRVTRRLEDDVKEKVETILRIHHKSISSMMSFDFIEVEYDTPFGELEEMIAKHEKALGRFPTIIVIEKGFPIGEIEGTDIVHRRAREKVGNFTRKVSTIQYTDSTHKLVEILRNRRHNKVIVLDNDESILGVIYSADVLHMLHEQTNRRLYNFAGVSHEEDILDSFLDKVRNRYKWLILNLGTAFIVAAVVGLFEDTIAAFTLLAIYMPVIAGMAGNAGTQTLAVAVRGIALGELDWKRGRSVLVNEVTAGAVNGIIVGIVVTLISIMWNQNILLGLIVGVAMVVNLVMAGFFGTIIPLIMKGLGKDPASSAAVFITTATDVFGFFTFLGLASVLL